MESISVKPCSNQLAKNTYLLKACIYRTSQLRKSIFAVNSAQTKKYGALKNIVQGSEHCR